MFDNKIQTFIIVHSQELLLHNFNRFRGAENITWLFVGSGETDKIEKVNNVVICRTLPDNIEKNRELLHYTAIHAILKNNLIKSTTEWIRLYEYDVYFSQDYFRGTKVLMQKTDAEIIGHRHPRHPHFEFTKLLLNQPAYLMEIISNSMFDYYGVSGWELLKKHTEWMCSINFVMRVGFLKNWNEWFLPMLPNFIGQRQAGNNIERAFSLYCFHKNIKFIKVNGLIHEYKNSHGTS